MAALTDGTNIFPQITTPPAPPVTPPVTTPVATNPPVTKTVAADTSKTQDTSKAATTVPPGSSLPPAGGGGAPGFVQTTTPSYDKDGSISGYTVLYQDGTSVFKPTTQPTSGGNNPQGSVSSTSPGVNAGAAPAGSKQSANGNWVDSNGNQFTLAPGSTTTTVDSSASPGDQMAQLLADYQTQATNVGNTINNIANGTTPLNPAEQAQVDGLKAQYEQLIQQQQQQNTNAQGVANIRGYQTGSGEYDPTFQVKTIGSIVSAGLGKIADLQTKEASAVATLTSALRDKDISAVKDAWDAYTKAADARRTALQDTITATAKAIADANTAAATTKKSIDDLAAAAAKNGASPATVQAIAAAPDYASALAAAGTSLATAKALSSGTGVSQLNLPSVGFTGTGSPNPTDQAAFLKSLPPDVATLVKGIADYSINPTTSPQKQYKGAAGLSQADMLSLVKQYDPTYDEKQYATRAAMIKNLTSGAYSQTINSANTLIQHLSKLQNDFNALQNGSFLPGVFNSGKNTFQNLGGSGKVNAVKSDILAVSSEAAKIYKGTGAPSEKEIEDWQSTVNPDMSPAQMKAAISSIVDLMGGKLATLADNYQGVMGAPLSSFAGGFTILTPRNAQVLQDMGFDPSFVDPAYNQAVEGGTYQGVTLPGSDTSSTEDSGTYNGVTLPN